MSGTPSTHGQRAGQQALALLQQGKLKEAEIIYEQLVREGTGSHVVFGNLAVLRRIQGRTREMIALLRQAIACDCNTPMPT